MTLTAIVSALDRGAGPQAMLALTDLAVFTPLGTVLVLFADTQPLCALALPELCSILERLLLLRGHREELETGSHPLDETFPLEFVRCFDAMRRAC
jgi:hypothetical protein